MTGRAIGLDLGTSGVRAALVDADGAAVALTSAPIFPDRRRAPEAWWDSAIVALDRLRDQTSFQSVRAIAICGTSGTILPVGPGGAKLAPASLYNDAADPADIARVAAHAPRQSAARGDTSPLARALPWRNLPGLVGVLHEADWLTGKLLGQFGCTDWNNALKTGFDPVALTWPAWISDLEFDPALLPVAVAPGTTLGVLDKSVAIELRLPADTTVVAGTTDGCAAFLATGAADAGDGVTSLGTTLTLKQLSSVAIFSPDHGVYSHRIGALWLAGGASNSGGAALARHFSAKRISALSVAIDPDRDTGLDYYPLPAMGERFPIADRRFSPRETPRPDDDATFLQGLLEGIARIESMGYRRLMELGGPPLKTVYSVGGGANNTQWTRIRERLLGVNTRVPRSREAAVGVACLALRSNVFQGCKSVGGTAAPTQPS